MNTGFRNTVIPITGALILSIGMTGCSKVAAETKSEAVSETTSEMTSEAISETTSEMTSEAVLETLTESSDNICEVTSCGYTVSVNLPEGYTCQVDHNYVICRLAADDTVLFEIEMNTIPDFVNYDEALGNDQMSAWYLSLTDGELVRTWKNGEVDCSLYLYEKRVPLGATEFETFEDEYGYYVLFSHSSAKYVYNTFFPTSMSEEEVEELLTGINVSFDASAM